jgi:hypothetical protein
MLAMVAYSKRELLSSYCRPPGTHESSHPCRPRVPPRARRLCVSTDRPGPC